MTALRLAAHGFACPLLRGALLRAFNIPEVGGAEIRLDFTSEVSGDAAFAWLEQAAVQMIETVDQLPRPLRPVVQTLRRKADVGAAVLGEPGEDLFHSVIINFLVRLFGGELYDARRIVALFGAEPTSIEADAVRLINQQLPISAWGIDEAYRTRPLTEVVITAGWLRGHADLALAFLEPSGLTEADLDELAALVAPYVLYILDVIRTSGSDDARQLITSLDLPAELAARNAAKTPLLAG